MSSVLAQSLSGLCPSVQQVLRHVESPSSQSSKEHSAPTINSASRNPHVQGCMGTYLGSWERVFLKAPRRLLIGKPYQSGLHVNAGASVVIWSSSGPVQAVVRGRRRRGLVGERRHVGGAFWDWLCVKVVVQKFRDFWARWQIMCQPRYSMRVLHSSQSCGLWASPHPACP